MNIESYKCSRFAGLKDIELNFTEGLNVILGPNEAGKSSIVDGIHSTLFRDTKLRKNNKRDLDFTFRFMPKPSGDFIDGKLVLNTAKGRYELAKEWGSSENISLETPTGNILKNNNDINEKLRELLNFGESTYSNIVFAKQRELKETLDNIIKNKDIVQEVNDLLRMTLMELDGISIDKIEENINEEIEKLFKRWDKDKNYPENNRGVNNPYKVGLGQIVKAYYEKEEFRLLMEEANRTEKEFEAISNKLKERKDDKAICDVEKTVLEAIEEDINKMEVLNIKIASLKKDLEELRTINTEWPQTEQMLVFTDEKLAALSKDRIKLNEEKDKLIKLDQKRELEKTLEKLTTIKEDIRTIEGEIQYIVKITDEDLKELERLQKEILTCETSMAAGKIIGKLVKAGKSVNITRDFEEKEVLALNEEFTANGLVKIEYEDDFEIEIKTGQIDFEELKKTYNNLTKEYKEKLDSLNIKDIESAKLNLEDIKRKENQVNFKRNEIKILLGDNKEEDLIEKIEELKDVDSSLNLKDIEGSLEELNQDQVKLQSDKNTLGDKLELWKSKYNSLDDLLDTMLEKRGQVKEKEEEFSKLKPLPEEFESPEEFKARLSLLKEKSLKYQGELDSLIEEYHEAKMNLPEDSFEEYKKAYILAEEDYERYLNRGDKLLLIQQVFQKTKEKMDKNPVEALEREFVRLLGNITAGKYAEGEIDEEFNLIVGNDDLQLPIELLSAGTYDSVSLALRFSLLKHIFQNKGYVILDDCLVDLDPFRKEEAVRMIKEFSEDYQIIFTTCDPETAKMLGGKLISL